MPSCCKSFSSFSLSHFSLDIYDTIYMIPFELLMALTDSDIFPYLFLNKIYIMCQCAPPPRPKGVSCNIGSDWLDALRSPLCWRSQCLPVLHQWKLLPASLLHPGDPLRFHAHYIAQCWAPGDPIPLQDLVSAGRLGTSVRKTLLLCSPQPDGKVVYTSLQWASLQ